MHTSAPNQTQHFNGPFQWKQIIVVEVHFNVHVLDNTSNKIEHRTNFFLLSHYFRLWVSLRKMKTHRRIFSLALFFYWPNILTKSILVQSQFFKYCSDNINREKLTNFFVSKLLFVRCKFQGGAPKHHFLHSCSFLLQKFATLRDHTWHCFLWSNLRIHKKKRKKVRSGSGNIYEEI